MPSEADREPVSHRKLRLGLLAAALVAAAVVAAGVVSRHTLAAELDRRAQAQATPTVAVVTPARAAVAATLELPGRIEAQSQAPIYARVSGYLKRWTVDIGAPVKAGQLLAEIETPDLDAQLAQAQAELASARSNAALAASTAKRWQALVATDSVSRQEADEKASDLANKESVVHALQANVERWRTLKRFARLTAPFDGTVTARNTDVGALIAVGGAPGSELFVVADLRRLRVYVDVPQTQVAAIHVGGVARLTVPERPGHVYAARVASMSHAIGAASGAMRVQLEAANSAGELLPGAYAAIAFELPREAGALAVPPGALIFNQKGLAVAVVGADDRVLVKPVTVARDLGSSIEIGSGLTAGDRVITNPPDGIASGDAVHVAAAEPAAANGGGNASGKAAGGTK
ncbi:MAG: efflux RND transporter periplasmic adaptor subunit [Burkholderiales bacterium]|nr:efflux RND transporter periplasmic adaptor subunit [Burkholderiales bacterium]